MTSSPIYKTIYFGSGAEAQRRFKQIEESMDATGLSLSQWLNEAIDQKLEADERKSKK